MSSSGYGLLQENMNKRPLNPITAEHRNTYRREGVVHLRRMFDRQWIERLRQGVDRLLEDPEKYGVPGPSHGASMASVCFMWRQPGVFRDFALNSPVGEVVGRVIGSDTIRVYHDHLFHKPPGSTKVMVWHCDETAWPVTGEMAPNIWIALTPVDRHNGRVEYVAGFHRHCVDNNLHFGFAPDQADGLCPDFETERDNPDFRFRFVSFDMEPGDAVVFHPSTPHFSRGNYSRTRPRTGLAVRVFGDDVRWYPAAHKAAIPGVDSLPEGEAPSGEFFPVIWQRGNSKEFAE
ncbi:MAG: phytanoyl-CoA dioxygenase family protein [Gammaproteobacteria bacterium]|nr:phytanoyl-CoA dioxygenase family protein [Gammaproteobacteria bacterium]MXZ26814.1 phytanoyl-CoA dioxygenase family protein [Gammaproteobacteria bacterium]MYF59464.1 phytanoyl-CoA dioxygenase family protein [Gammaproteobacteria bacterium]